MPLQVRRADIVWTGDLHGNGKVKVGSGALAEFPVTFSARTEAAGGKTSPEELLAAAHAGCFAMALSNTLDKAGHPPTRLDIVAACTFETGGEGGSKISTMELQVRGTVPGIDQARFEELARQGEQGCPVSNALRNNVRITVSAQLMT